MLADKLLANLDYNTDKERHTLELLKLRFGETSMNSAEVMIKDIDDSVRSNKNIHDSLLNRPRIIPLRRGPSPWMPPPVDAAMISHIFWPKMQNEALRHHPRIQAELDAFGQVYAEQKNPRKLNWINQLGTVQLEIDVVEDGPDATPPIVETKEFTCSPLLATLLSHFEDEPTWTAEALSNETGIAENIIRKRMLYWITHRVVVVVGEHEAAHYTLATRAQRQGGGGIDPHHHHDHHDDEGVGDGHTTTAVSAATQQEEEHEVYESYISVMLTSLKDGASLDKIHNMLKMMASGSETKYNKTPQQLSAFLQRLCRQEKLECGPDGTYKLVKKPVGRRDE
jgi:anaphase-promoting complex subunit 2